MTYSYMHAFNRLHNSDSHGGSGEWIQGLNQPSHLACNQHNLKCRGQAIYINDYAVFLFCADKIKPSKVQC